MIRDPLSRLTSASVAHAGQVRVSVIMLTFNRPQFVDRAIQSVVDQNYSAWELIIVDDSVGCEAERLIAIWMEQEPRISYFHRDQRGNIAHATNFGLRQAQGEYIAILDDDDYWIAKDKLTKQVELLDLRPDAVACGGGAVVVDEDGRDSLRYLKPEDDGSLRKWALVANPILHSTSMFRAAQIVECGFYDETLPGFQDWDVFLKLGRVGRLCNVSEAFVSYTIWEGGGSFRGHHANTRAAIRIVLRHGRHYKNFYPALLFASLNYIYARFPRAIKRLSFSFLSKVKKSVFSARVKPA